MTSRFVLRCVLASTLLAAASSACAQEPRTPAEALRSAREALRTGRYDDALAQARRAMGRDSANAEPVRILAAALVTTGKYTEAETELVRYIAAHPRIAELWNALGEVQRERGRLADAESSFRRAVDGRARDSLTAALNLAVLRFDRGEVDEAMREFDHFIDVYNTRRSRLSASELAAVAAACRYLGRNNWQLFKDALKAYDEAIAADSTNLEVRVRLAELFLEKYQSQEARGTLAAVLKVNPRHPGALLAMSRVRFFDEESDAVQYVNRSLEVNPASPEARALSAMLLTDLERYSEAEAEARRGLSTDSTAPDALIALAAAQFLQGDTARFRASLDRVHAREPKSADAEATLAEIAARTRRYAEAADFAKAATVRDPKSARALAFLGINALRLGEIEQGRGYLERAFDLDPYNVWTKNTLDMVDTFKDYAEVRTPRFLLVIEKKDAPLLSLYAETVAEQAYDSLAARYGYRPPAPIRIEFYRSHEDFSVRTVGLADPLGALGVTFGQVVAMDSPAARKTGEFNWGSTLWHELAHVFTLGASDNRVPRWFSEGLSVYEERRARPSWGDDPSPLFLAALSAGQLPKVSRMNDGFVRPSFPAQIVLSYYLASLVVEMIEQEHGMGATRAMLEGYRRGKTTDQLVREVLKTEPAALDQHADEWVRRRFAKQMASIKPLPAPRRDAGAEAIAVSGEFVDALERGRKLLESGKVDEAIAVLEGAKSIFPEYAAENGPYGLLARAHQQRGAKREAANELATLTSMNELAYRSNVALADALEELGDSQGAIAALDRTLWINPFDAKIHERIVALASRVPDRRLAVRERKALLALDPVDRVEALYQLALAHSEAGDVVSARREVLRALEIAPNFEKAQELLLKLRGTRPLGGKK